MEEYMIAQDLPVVCFKATSFPMGVAAAYTKMHEAIPAATSCVNYGISHGGKDGGITYMAAVAEQDAGVNAASAEAKFTIKAGRYAREVLRDFKGKEYLFAQTFEALLKHPEVDPQGYCVEIYQEENEAICLVKLQDK